MSVRILWRSIITENLGIVCILLLKRRVHNKFVYENTNIHTTFIYTGLKFKANKLVGSCTK